MEVGDLGDRQPAPCLHEDVPEVALDLTAFALLGELLGDEVLGDRCEGVGALACLFIALALLLLAGVDTPREQLVPFSGLLARLLQGDSAVYAEHAPCGVGRVPTARIAGDEGECHGSVFGHSHREPWRHRVGDLVPRASGRGLQRLEPLVGKLLPLPRAGHATLPRGNVGATKIVFLNVAPRFSTLRQRAQKARKHGAISTALMLDVISCFDGGDGS